MTTFTTLLAAVAVAASPIAPALAQQEGASIRVATHDLDLASARGQHTLRLRIARAASEVCGGVNDRFDLGVRVAQRQCRDAAVAMASVSAQAPRRTAAR